MHISSEDVDYGDTSTIVYVQIFKVCNFHRQSKSNIVALLFLSIICYQPLCSICIDWMIALKNEGLIFMNDKVTHKNSENYIPCTYTV